MGVIPFAELLPVFSFPSFLKVGSINYVELIFELI